MPTYLECVCCKEISQIIAKISEANDSSVTCITQGWLGKKIRVTLPACAVKKIRDTFFHLAIMKGFTSIIGVLIAMNVMKISFCV